MRTPNPLPPALTGRCFSTREARALGVTAARLSRSDLAAPFTGVRCPAGSDAVVCPAAVPDGPERWKRLHELALARAEALLPVLPAGAVFAHLTAAQIHRLPLPPRLVADVTVHIAVRGQAERHRREGVCVHLVPPGRQRSQQKNGLPVTSAVDTWCALAAALTVEELVVMGDALVRRKRPLATMAQLKEAVAGYAGRSGAKRLRAALVLVRPRTDSPAESELRLAIVEGGLPEPEVNVWVVNRQGDRLRLGDLVYRRERVLVEYDGPHHFDDAAQQQKDVDVLDAAVADGWRVIRAHIRHRRERFAPVVARIRAALDERRFGG